jgi:hydrogenase maturation protease
VIGAGRRVLVAGVGNVFLGDDGFGPQAAAALLRRPLPAGVHVEDFGIRGFDLAYALLDGYAAALLLDASPRGEEPGTVTVLEPDLRALAAAPGGPDAHAMDPVTVLSLALRLGGGPLPRVLVVACEPAVWIGGDRPDVVVGLSEPVRRAVGRAVAVVEGLLAGLLTAEPAT